MPPLKTSRNIKKLAQRRMWPHNTHLLWGDLVTEQVMLLLHVMLSRPHLCKTSSASDKNLKVVKWMLREANLSAGFTLFTKNLFPY